MTLTETVGFWAGVVLPLFDISLIAHVIKRKSSADISLLWAFGLWLTSVLMMPSAFVSGNIQAIGFNSMNVLMLTLVVIVVFKYRKGRV